MPEQVTPRGRSDHPAGTRLSLVERDIESLSKQLDQHIIDARREHREFTDAIKGLDDRTDRIATRVSVAFAVVGAIWAIVIVLLPIIRDLLRIPSL